MLTSTAKYSQSMIMRLVMADGDLTTMILTATLNCSRTIALTTTASMRIRLLIASQDEPDTDKRMDELNQAEQDILADGAFVPLQARNIYYMLDDDTTGINFYYCSLNIDWVYADVNAK